MNWQGAGYLLLTSFLWGTNWPVMKFLFSELPPVSARTTSCLVCIAVMLGASGGPS